MLLIFVRMNVQTRRAMIVYISFMRWFLQHPISISSYRKSFAVLNCFFATVKFPAARHLSPSSCPALLFLLDRQVDFCGSNKGCNFWTAFPPFLSHPNTFIRLLFIWYKKTAHLSPSFIAKSITFKYINDSVCTETSFCLAQ